MQRGTEVPLAYNTTANFTNKPTNLIFYSNSEKTEALVIENEKYLNFNGYFSSEGNKKRYIPIYWEWKFETGNTQKEIDKNNLIDSEFMRKIMSMKIETIGEQVAEKPMEKQRIKFNANGGIFPQYGNAKIVIKQVINGNQYGDVSIPTREGYKFVGWSTVKGISSVENSINVHALWAKIKK